MKPILKVLTNIVVFIICIPTLYDSLSYILKWMALFYQEAQTKSMQTLTLFIAGGSQHDDMRMSLIFSCLFSLLLILGMILIINELYTFLTKGALKKEDASTANLEKKEPLNIKKDLKA